LTFLFEFGSSLSVVRLLEIYITPFSLSFRKNGRIYKPSLLCKPKKGSSTFHVFLYITHDGLQLRPKIAREITGKHEDPELRIELSPEFLQ